MALCCPNFQRWFWLVSQSFWHCLVYWEQLPDQSSDNTFCKILNHENIFSEEFNRRPFLQWAFSEKKQLLLVWFKGDFLADQHILLSFNPNYDCMEFFFQIHEDLHKWFWNSKYKFCKFWISEPFVKIFVNLKISRCILGWL